MFVLLQSRLSYRMDQTKMNSRSYHKSRKYCQIACLLAVFITAVVYMLANNYSFELKLAHQSEKLANQEQMLSQQKLLSKSLSEALNESITDLGKELDQSRKNISDLELLYRNLSQSLNFDNTSGMLQKNDYRICNISDYLKLLHRNLSQSIERYENTSALLQENDSRVRSSMEELIELVRHPVKIFERCTKSADSCQIGSASKYWKSCSTRFLPMEKRVSFVHIFFVYQTLRDQGLGMSSCYMYMY